MLESGSSDFTIKLWDTTTGTCLQLLSGTRTMFEAPPLILRATRWPAVVVTRRSLCGRQPLAICYAGSKGTPRLWTLSPSPVTGSCLP